MFKLIQFDIYFIVNYILHLSNNLVKLLTRACEIYSLLDMI